VYEESKRIIQRAIRDKKLVVFIGAGASIESKVPSWSDAVAQIGAHIYPPIDTKNTDFLKIPQFYFNSRCEKEYIELMKEVFDFSDKKPNEIHRRVFDFDPTTVITTNYDDFLERAAAEKGIFPDIIEKDDDLPYARSDRMIIKMHGGFKHNNFVLKEDDYLNYSRNFILIETYVKALLASKVILFVGYSYNDPDTKQIFNWVKNILSEDFQHAYLINADSDYNENTDKYFKNMGINILYYQQLLKENFCNESVYKNTLDFIQYLLSVKQPIEISDKLYSSLVHLDQLNCVEPKAVERALRGFDTIIQYDTINTKSDVLFNYFKSDHSNDKQFNIIESVFHKAGIRQVIKDLPRALDRDRNETYTLPSPAQAAIFYDGLDDFNFIRTRKFVDSTDVSDDLTTDEVKYQVAQGYYELGEYAKCYHVLKKLSGKYRQEKNSLWHFITEFNRVHVGKYATSMAMWDQDSDSALIQLDIENIDLSALSWEYGGKYNSELGDIMKKLTGFNFVYSALYNVISSREKVEEQAEKRWIVSDQRIDQLSNNIKSFYNFIQLNHLLIDHFSEVREVFKQYISSAFYAMSKPQDESSDFIISKNVVLLQLPEEVVLFTIRYLSEKDLEKILDKNGLEFIELTDEATNRLLVVFNNLVRAVKNGMSNSRIREKLFVSLKILSLTSLSEENLAKVMDSIIELEKGLYFKNNKHQKLHSFLAKQYSFNKLYTKYEKLEMLISIMSVNIKNKRYDTLDYNPIPYIKPLFAFCCAVIYEIDSSFKLDDTICDERLIDRWEIATSVYKIASKKRKNLITRKIYKIIEGSEIVSPEFYCDVVFAEIVKPTVEYENKIYQYVFQKIKQATKGVEFNPDPVESALSGVLDLCYNGKLLEPAKFNSFFSERSEIWNFLYQMDKFDYSLFDFKWIKRFGKNVKQKMSDNPMVKNEINRLYKQEFENGEIDKPLLEDYLRYFS